MVMKEMETTTSTGREMKLNKTIVTGTMRKIENGNFSVRSFVEVVEFFPATEDEKYDLMCFFIQAIGARALME